MKKSLLVRLFIIEGELGEQPPAASCEFLMGEFNEFTNPVSRAVAHEFAHAYRALLNEYKNKLRTLTPDGGYRAK